MRRSPLPTAALLRIWQALRAPDDTATSEPCWVCTGDPSSGPPCPDHLAQVRDTVGNEAQLDPRYYSDLPRPHVRRQQPR